MKKIIVATIAIAFTLASTAQNVDHAQWDALLKKYVSSTGKVNYKGFKADRPNLQKYLRVLMSNPPKSTWSKNERKAYWMNAYNAFTIELIVKNYPVKSIKDIANGKPWDLKFIKIGSKTYSLNDIEHNILRKYYGDPRIHFGIVCASYSCPKLVNKAFTTENVNSTLSANARQFINDPKRNKITAGSAQISKLFEWFKDDFTKTGTVKEYLNKYSKVKLTSSTKISYMTYNWSLNE